MIPVTFIWIMLGLIGVGMPIVFALGAAPMLGLVFADKEVFLAIIAQKLYIGINQFPLLAIPMFILAGEIINVGVLQNALSILPKFWSGICVAASRM